jgi:hypothetical protein
MSPSVDEAMADDRPAKQTVRSAWMDHLESAKDRLGNHAPLYLTLCGASGTDVLLAAKRGIIRLSEVGGIHEDDLNQVVAVERSLRAVGALQTKIPGLNIRIANFPELLQGNNPTAWPGPDDSRFCRAKVVNLDLNGKYESSLGSTGIFFPIATWVNKLAMLHSQETAIDWTLFLTVNSRCEWDNETWGYAQNVLRHNMENHQDFLDGIRSVCSESVVEAISSETCVLEEMSDQDMQGMLIAFIPKTLCQSLPNGYVLNVRRSFAYGAEKSTTATMVSLIVEFQQKHDVLGLTDASYELSVASIFSDVASIDQDGRCQTLTN